MRRLLNWRNAGGRIARIESLQGERLMRNEGCSAAARDATAQLEARPAEL
jgi:hypothetical protein